ncbi:MAG: zinc ribbon domain-containing protein [Pseudomonadota bacterium]
MAQVCQSCGMPMKQDPAGGGTEADGSTSSKYCSLCYDAGTFRMAGITVKEMQDFCIDALQKKGMPRFMCWALTRGLPKLERWRGA